MERFDKVEISQLTPGDIFTTEIKIINREAFMLKEFKGKQAICESRITGKEVKKQASMKVFYLRTEN